MAVPIKRCPCCNQCAQASGSICYYINLQLIETRSNNHAGLYAHISAYSADIVRETAEQQGLLTHARTRAPRRAHRHSWRGRQPSGPVAEHNALCLVHKQILMRSLQHWLVFLGLWLKVQFQVCIGLLQTFQNLKVSHKKMQEGCPFTCLPGLIGTCPVWPLQRTYLLFNRLDERTKTQQEPEGWSPDW